MIVRPVIVDLNIFQLVSFINFPTATFIKIALQKAEFSHLMFGTFHIKECCVEQLSVTERVLCLQLSVD